MRSLVLTFLGRDRPGLVGALAALVTEHGGNWEESRMASLAGEFAGILRVTVADESAAGLERALGELTEHLQVVVKSGSDAAVATGELIRLELTGHDRPGIVREISRALASRGVNVEELDSEVTSAPMSGEPLFRAQALLRVPEDLSSRDLRAGLESIAEDLMVDIDLRPAQTPSAVRSSS